MDPVEATASMVCYGSMQDVFWCHKLRFYIFGRSERPKQLHVSISPGCSCEANMTALDLPAIYIHSPLSEFLITYMQE